MRAGKQPLGRGTDHVAHLVHGHLVVRCAEADDAAAAAEREARLLEFVAPICPVAIPRPEWVADGCLAYERLPGTPMLELAEDARARITEPVARQAGAVLAALHRISPDGVRALVDTDDHPPQLWLREAAEHYEVTATAIPAELRPRVERFLQSAPPPKAEELAFSHNDLGIEHLLVDPASARVTGLIDWSDAALTDTATDFGRLLRDLGPEALTAALSAYELDADKTELASRAQFYACCGWLEDLAYGIAASRPEYVAKSLATVRTWPTT